MSCGNNHKYDAYQKASDALKNAVIEALNNDEETSTLTALWEHFLGARSIADKASRSSSSIFGDDSVITFGDIGEVPVGAAQPVPMDGIFGVGTDVTNFTMPSLDDNLIS
tara:strand:+ start:5242 stop:5571 length:330 start_codon:yes stop_codon:yes gene_type:complete